MCCVICLMIIFTLGRRLRIRILFKDIIEDVLSKLKALPIILITQKLHTTTKIITKILKPSIKPLKTLKNPLKSPNPPN